MKSRRPLGPTVSVRLFAAVVCVSAATILGFPDAAAAQGLSKSTSVSFAALAAVSAVPLEAAPRAEDAERADRIGALGQARLPAPARLELGGVGRAWNLLASLYATTATMQMLDVDSTLKSLRRGAVESNPVMAGLVNNKAAFVAAKAGVAAATIYAVHKISKQSKVGAVLTLVGINSAYAMIVKNNYAIAKR